MSWGRMEHARGRHDRAESKYRDALGMFERIPGDHAYTLGTIRAELGRCLADQNRLADAEPFLESGDETLRSKRGAADGLTVAALQRLAALYEATGRQPRAAELRRKIPDGVTDVPHPPHRGWGPLASGPTRRARSAARRGRSYGLRETVTSLIVPVKRNGGV